jgi:hypothetical protein
MTALTNTDKLASGRCKAQDLVVYKSIVEDDLCLLDGLLGSER